MDIKLDASILVNEPEVIKAIEKFYGIKQGRLEDLIREQHNDDGLTDLVDYATIRDLNR